jgi:group I intron endonuclease
MFCVYKIRNIKNNKLYIGKTENIDERWTKHISDMRTNRGYVFHSAINKYGVNNFEIFIIEEFEQEEKALKREIFWIAYYKTNIRKYGNNFGYNMTDGGEGISGYSHTASAKQKMSDATKGKPKSEDHKKQLSIAHSGKILSQETKDKIGISSSGRRHTDETKQKVSLAKLGEKNPQSILNERKVRKIKILLIDNIMSSSEIAKKYKVAPRTIRDIKNNKTWKHIT